MIIVILFIILGVFVGYKMAEDMLDEFVDYVFGCIPMLLFGMIFGFLGFGLSALLPAKMHTVIVTDKVVSLQDGSSVSGNFFLGCGTIEGKMKYTYYRDSNGVFSMNQLPMESTTIVYSELEPKVEQHTTCMVEGAFINYFAIDVPYDKYVVYVPKGTIKNGFSLDAQ